MTYPLATLAAVIDSSGISAPQYADIFASLQASFQSIFGSDSYIGPDSQDGQLLAIVAKAISDSNDTAIAVYNSFSPATAQGAALSSMVKINGIKRNVPSNSQVGVTVTGVVGTVITGGIVADSVYQWALPTPLTIPIGGFINTTATCTTPGAIAALAGTVNKIITPTLGWQSVTNATAASAGAPVESDASLRARQGFSVALPSLTVLAGIVGVIEALTGVTQCVAYENDTNSTDANGLPPHSISMVVLGGAAAAIANAISSKKTPGAATYGTTSAVVVDSVGVAHTINYYVPTPKTITVAVSLHPLTSGYTSAIGVSVVAAIVSYINALMIGDDVERARLYLPAQLYGSADSLTYNITAIQIAISPGAVGTSDLTIAFNERATTTTGSVTLTLV